VLVGIGIEAFELFATQPVLTKLLNKGPDLHEYHRLVGNAQLLILGIVLAWVLAAFGEEIVWRGYLLNRVAEIFGRSTSSWIASAILVSLLFGFAHFHQGPTGIVENVIDGAILAGVYFATGRNLLAPIIAHGIQDTVDVLLIYLGWYPGFQQSLALPT
jgi:membrane protease YdiL (CAAX protease family)